MTDFPISDEAVDDRLQQAAEALRFIGTSPWTEADHPSAAYARSTTASLAGEDDEPRV